MTDISTQNILNQVAANMNRAVSDLPSEVRGTVESLVANPVVYGCEPDEIQAERYAEGAATDMVIDLQGSVGGGGGGGGSLPGCYEISAKDEEKGLASGDFVNCHIICGGLCVQGPTGNAWNFANKVVALRISRDYASCGLVGYNDFSEIEDDQVANDYAICPLYKIGDVKTDEETGEKSGVIEADYRNIPHFDTWAALP